MIQREMFKQRGGRREGAGRPKVLGSMNPRVARPRHANRYPVHVNVKVVKDFPRLRRRRFLGLLRDAIRDSHKGSFRVVDFSIQKNHLHFIVEAARTEALSRGMQGLMIRIARRLNKLLGRKGKVFADRFFGKALKTPREVRHAVRYVVNNARKHGLRYAKDLADPYSSGIWFDGWRQGPSNYSSSDEPAVAEPRTWLRGTGWRRHGLLQPDDVPGR